MSYQLVTVGRIIKAWDRKLTSQGREIDELVDWWSGLVACSQQATLKVWYRNPPGERFVSNFTHRMADCLQLMKGNPATAFAILLGFNLLRSLWQNLTNSDRAKFARACSSRWVALFLSLTTPGGPREIAVRSSRAASLLGDYWNAVQAYLETGDKSRLAKFQGKSVTDASGAKLPLLTDVNELDRLGSAGVLSFESLYRRVA